MRLICVECGNYVHFEVDVEIIRALKSNSHGLSAQDHCSESGNETDSTLRLGVAELVDYCTREHKETLHIDPGTGNYVNSYISCGRCGSRRVTIPYCPWRPPSKHVPLQKEIQDNHDEYQWLRKERDRHADNLPVVRQSGKIHHPTVGSSNIQDRG